MAQKYINLKSKYFHERIEYSQTPTVIGMFNLRTFIYKNEIVGLQKSDYPRTKQFIPYYIYYFINESPLENVSEEKDMNYVRACMMDYDHKMDDICYFLNIFFKHYNWLIGKYRTLKL